MEFLYKCSGDDKLLYVGVSNNWPRRMGEHQTSKEWFADVDHVDLLRFADREAVLAAEKLAIKSERPLYNKQHNGGRVEVEVTVKASVGTNGANLALFAAGACAAYLLLRWAADVGSAWWVKRRAAAEGTDIEVPRPRNPFTEDPAPVALGLMFGFIGIANEMSQPGSAYRENCLARFASTSLTSLDA